MVGETSEGKQGEGPGRMLSKEEIERLLKQGEKKESKPGTEKPVSTAGGKEALEGVGSIDMIRDVSMNVRIELGRSKMTVQDILKLKQGSVVTLDKLAGDYVDVLVNDRLVARGEVLILNDNFCVRVVEIVAEDDSQTGGQ